MKFLKWLLIAVIFCGGLVHSARADEASKQAKIDQMLDVMHADQIVTQMIGQVNNMVAAQAKQMHLPDSARPAMEEMRKRLTELLAQELSWDKMRPVYVKIYNETFSEDEIGGIIEFYRSPAGQALPNKMPQIIQKSTELMQVTMNDLMPKVSAIADDVMKKYGQK